MVTNCVLLIDDDEAVLSFVSEILGDAGFEVVEAISAKNAIEVFEASPQRFRGLVTDVNLGYGPDGWDVARRARELSPAIPVVYMTGASAHDWPARGVPNSQLICKPFAAAQIVTGLTTLIDQTDPKLGGSG